MPKSTNTMQKANFIINLILCHLSFCVAIRVHCRHVERIHEDHIHLCCKHPDGHNDVTEMCAKKTGFKSLPSASEEAPEDVTVDQVMLGACWAKCVFDHYGFLEKDDQTLNMMAVRSHYKMYHQSDPEYETEMLSAFDKCHSQSEEAMTKFLSMTFVKALSDSNYCKPASSVILSCVIYHFFHNCPKDRWSNSTECVETLAFAKKCKDVLTTM